MRAERELVVRGLEPGPDEWMVEEDPQPDVAEQRPLGVALDLTRRIDLVDPEKLGEPFDRITARRRSSRTDGEHDGEEREQLPPAGAVAGDADHREQARGEPEAEDARHRPGESCPEPTGDARGDHPPSTDEPFAGDHRHQRDRQDARREGREVVRPDERRLALGRAAAAELVDHTCELEDRPGGRSDAGCDEHRDEEPSLPIGSKEQRERRNEERVLGEPRRGDELRPPLVRLVAQHREKDPCEAKRAQSSHCGEETLRRYERAEALASADDDRRHHDREDGGVGERDASMLVPPASSERFGW